MSKSVKPVFSAPISQFLCLATQAMKDYDWNAGQVQRLSNLVNDYEHKMELEAFTYKERAKLATKLAETLRLRRASKDTVMGLEPLVSFLRGPDGQKMLNSLREALGKTRKTEQMFQNRTYRFKVLDEADIRQKEGEA